MGDRKKLSTLVIVVVAFALLAGGCEQEEATAGPSATVPSSQPGSHPEDERALEDELVKRPEDGVALKRYAHRVADVHLGRPDGPVVARLHPGALVSVAPTKEPRCEITVPGYEFRGFVESDALSPDPVPESIPKLRGTVYRDHGLYLLDPEDPRGRLFARLHCGEFILEDGLARQFRLGVEVFGQVTAKPETRAGHFDCLPRESTRAQASSSCTADLRAMASP